MQRAWREDYVDVNGIKAHYLEAGQGEETLLLIHGGGASSCAELNYGCVLGLLAEQLHVIAVDVVGFGFTSPAGPEHYSATAQGDFLVAFMQELDLVAHVGGNSHGGWLSQYVAHQARQRVKRLLIINSLNGTQAIPPAPLGMKYIFSPVGHAHEYPTRSGIEQELSAFYIDQSIVTEERIERTLEIALRNHAFARARAAATSSTIAEANENLNYQGKHIAQYADQLTMPVLMTWSRENRGSKPEDAMPFYNLINDVEMHVFPRAGHHVMTEHPQRWTSVVLDFLHSAR